MAKLKPLAPTLRETKRYIAFNILAKKHIPYEECKKTISKSSQELFGLTGAAQMGIILLEDHYKNNTGVLRVAHNKQHEIRALFCFINSIANTPCTIKSNKSSGILQKVT